MSFIRDVVTIDNNEASLDARKNLTKISTEIVRFQDKTKDFIERNYSEFLPNLLSNEIYLSEGEKLVKEVEDLLQNIETNTKQELCSANDELKQYQIELEEIAIGIHNSHQILKIEENFQQLENAKKHQEYRLEMEIIKELKNLINNPYDISFKQLQCYNYIKIKYQIESEMLLHNLKQCFEQLVQFHEKTFHNTKSITLKITKNQKQLNDTIIALFNVKYNPRKLCNFLLNNCFIPIIMKPVSINCSTNHEDADEYEQFSISYSLKELPENLRPNYQIVLKNFYNLIEYLKLMNIHLIDIDKYVLNIFGEYMKKNLINLLINECLQYAIPSTMDEMNDSTLVNDIIELNQFLINANILIENIDDDLLKYANNIGILFRNRLCTIILDNSIEIMHKDLHDMSLITNTNHTLSDDNPLIFPKSMVSRNTLELICLMEKIIKEAQNANKETADKLLSVIPKIIDQYIIEIPTYHHKMIINIPQQTALFHNNCMYLANWLIKNQCKDIENVETLAKQLQNLGTQHFVKQIQNQHKQLLEILKEFDISDILSEIGIGPQKIIRQCLRQLDLLKNVWQTILPELVYIKTMSNLLSDFCTEIIRTILIVEDLPTILSNELVDVINVIEERASTLFQDKHEILQVKNWMKLMQLKMILNATLIQITEQWSEGKGPLTLNYKSDEIKHLIRALFQNTDQRSTALASII